MISAKKRMSLNELIEQLPSFVADLNVNSQDRFLKEKPVVGQEILMVTDNRYGLSIEKKTVSKVGRKYFTLDKTSPYIKFSIDTKKEVDNFDSHTMLFFNSDCYKCWKHKQTLAQGIKNKINEGCGLGILDSVSVEDLVGIASLLSKHEGK